MDLGRLLVAFWEPFDGSRGLRGSDWVQTRHHGSKLWYWESLLVPPGCTLGGLGSSLIACGGHLVPFWVPRASKMDAVGNQADIAKTIENNWFLMVLECWRGIWWLLECLFRPELELRLIALGLSRPVFWSFDK